MIQDPLTVGERVTISFVAPTLWDPVPIQGRVAWVGPPTRVEPSRFGFAFDARDPWALFALFELMGTLTYV